MTTMTTIPTTINGQWSIAITPERAIGPNGENLDINLYSTGAGDGGATDYTPEEGKKFRENVENTPVPSND